MINNLRKISYVLVLSCILLNLGTITFAKTENLADDKEVEEHINKTKKALKNGLDVKKTDDDVCISKAEIFIDEVSNSNSIESSGEAYVTASSSPWAVVITKVKCIGGGLVDLDTSATANMGISSVYGSHYYWGSPFGQRSFSIWRPSNNNVPFMNETDQRSENVGSFIEFCNSYGTMIFNYLYSRSWETLPYDLNAYVY